MTLTDVYAEDVSSADKIQSLKSRLLDTNEPLAKRMRIVCSLRAVQGQGTVEALASCLNDESALLRHEIAYALGQKEESTAIPVLLTTLRNDVDPMVRHEAAEALGAIAAPETIEVLKEFEHCDVEEVAHTCQLALDRIRWKSQQTDGSAQSNKFITVDPAPAADPTLSESDHTDRLLNSSLSLFERYGSLFALRDRGTKEAVLGLTRALLEDKSSALLRHEIAFVLGQLQHKAALAALESSLRNLAENQMVRHEAAEAIGAILENSAKCKTLLEEFSKDPNRVVAESCVVALDISDYWSDDTQFQYAELG